MKYKIGIFGSAADTKPEIKDKAKELGNSLSKHNVELITGACSGLPYIVAKTAFDHAKTPIIGFSPAKNVMEQKQFTPDDDLSIYKTINYVPDDFEYSDILDVSKKYRNVLSTAYCDAGIILSGRWGTMNEFTNLFDMGKVIGVLTETGGISDEIPVLMKRINKKTQAKVIINNSADKLVKDILTQLKTSLF